MVLLKKFLKLFQLFLLLIFLPNWTTIGINFRDGSTYATDGANETYCRGQSDDQYPTVRGGGTFGWNANYDNGRDRDNTLDRRLAGITYRANDGTQSIWRLDLPAPGSYDIRLAIGDATQTPSYLRVDIFDDTNMLFTCTDTDGVTTEGDFLDANCVERTKANWPANNTARTVTFTTSTLYLKLGAATAQSSSSAIAHIQVTQNAGAAVPYFSVLEANGEL